MAGESRVPDGSDPSVDVPTVEIALLRSKGAECAARAGRAASDVAATLRRLAELTDRIEQHQRLLHSRPA